ncbi:MAG TPA: flippase [Gammaproteobacteria bacterium]|nr:flippase [Gammaproteobacteria bacterium]
MRDTLRADLNINSERGRLVRSAGATAAIKVGATIVSFGASLLYARVLGPHDYGLYAYVLAWVAVLTIPSGLGLPPYLIREGARAPGKLHALRRWADGRVLVSGLVIAVLMASAVFLPSAAGARWLFIIAAPLPLLNNLGYVRRALIQAHGWVARSQFPALLLAPVLMLITLLVVWQLTGSLNTTVVMIAMTTVALVPFIANSLQLRRIETPDERSNYSLSLGSALPFVWFGTLYLLNSRIDLIILGALKGAHAAGIYAVATRATDFIAFFLLAANIVIESRIARLHHGGEIKALQRLLTAAMRRVAVLTLPLALLLILGATPMLRYLYGTPYAEGAIAMRILAAAQLVNVLAGPTATILNMTGGERYSVRGTALAVLFNCALNLLLIPLYGLAGSAIATGISLVGWNILLWYWVRTKLQLRPSAIGL